MNKVEKKMRVCLRCNKEFMSQSKGNRVCPNCSKSSVSRDPIKTPFNYKSSHLRGD